MERQLHFQGISPRYRIGKSPGAGGLTVHPALVAGARSRSFAWRKVTFLASLTVDTFDTDMLYIKINFSIVLNSSDETLTSLKAFDDNEALIIY